MTPTMHITTDNNVIMIQPRNLVRPRYGIQVAGHHQGCNPD